MTETRLFRIRLTARLWAVAIFFSLWAAARWALTWARLWAAASFFSLCAWARWALSLAALACLCSALFRAASAFSLWVAAWLILLVGLGLLLVFFPIFVPVLLLLLGGGLGGRADLGVGALNRAE